jgi:hypothetical protein
MRKYAHLATMCSPSGGWMPTLLSFRPDTERHRFAGSVILAQQR